MSAEKRIWRFNRQSRRLVILAVACGVLAAILHLVQLVLISEIVSGVFIGDQDRAGVRPLLVVMLVLIGIRPFILWLSDIIVQRASSLLKASLRQRITSRILQLGPAFTSTERSGELVNTAVAAVENIDGYLTEFLPARYMAAIVPAITFLLVLAIDPWTTLVLLFAGPMLILLLALIGGRTKAIAERRFWELSWMSAFFLDILQGIPTLKLFGRSREQVDNIQEISRQYGNTAMELLRTAFQTSLVMEWAATAATAMVALEVSLRLMNGAIPFNQALAALLLTPEFFVPLRQMALRYHAGVTGKTAATRLFDVLDTPIPVGTPAAQSEAATAAPETDIRTLPSGAITFCNVHVAYDEGRRIALDGISFTIAEGQQVALVGPTGSGKSTVANLLLRFIQPDTGTVTVGGVALSSLAPEAWRTQVAWVPQNPHLFFGTVADNLRLARPQASAAELEHAAREANAHEFITMLSRGYDTPIGEQGVRLSGGQRQRIAIARAFLKQARILVLDEATANLDEENEALIRDALARLTRGRTVLMIAHRLQMVQDVDTIIVLENGRIAEMGSPADLSDRSGSYHTLVTAFDGGAA